MDFTQTKPCPKCPFRTDFGPYLRRERAEDIADALEMGSTFTCHETTVPDDEDEEGLGMRDGPNAQMCAGAMIVLERMEMPNQMMRISERLGLYDHRRLDMDAPVYDDLYEWVDAHDV